MRAIEKTRFNNKVTADSLRETIDQVFGHLMDTVPWDELHIRLGGYVFHPFELTSRIEEAWRFWRETDVAERVIRRNHLEPLSSDDFTFAAIFEAAVASVSGEETRLPWFARPAKDRDHGPRLARPERTLSVMNVTWRTKLSAASAA